MKSRSRKLDLFFGFCLEEGGERLGAFVEKLAFVPLLLADRYGLMLPCAPARWAADRMQNRCGLKQRCMYHFIHECVFCICIVRPDAQIPPSSYNTPPLPPFQIHSPRAIPLPCTRRQ